MCTLTQWESKIKKENARERNLGNINTTIISIMGNINTQERKGQYHNPQKLLW